MPALRPAPTTAARARRRPGRAAGTGDSPAARHHVRRRPARLGAGHPGTCSPRSASGRSCLSTAVASARIPSTSSWPELRRERERGRVELAQNAGPLAHTDVVWAPGPTGPVSWSTGAGGEPARLASSGAGRSRGRGAAAPQPRRCADRTGVRRPVGRLRAALDERCAHPGRAHLLDVPPLRRAAGRLRRRPGRPDASCPRRPADCRSAPETRRTSAGDLRAWLDSA